MAWRFEKKERKKAVTVQPGSCTVGFRKLLQLHVARLVSTYYRLMVVTIIPSDSDYGYI